MVQTIISLLMGNWLRVAIIGTLIAGGLWLADDYRYKTEQIAVLKDREAGWKKSIQACQENAKQFKQALESQADAKEAFRADVETTCKNWESVKESETPIGDLLEKLKEAEEAKEKAKP
jgi:hypothetical protein